MSVNKEADTQIASNGACKRTAEKLAEHPQHLLSSLRPAPRKGNCNLIIYSHRCLVTKYILIRPEAALLFRAELSPEASVAMACKDKDRCRSGCTLNGHFIGSTFGCTGGPSRRSRHAADLWHGYWLQPEGEIQGIRG